MIDWSKYPLCGARRWSPSWRDEVDRLITDVRRAERKRCKEACRTVAEEIDDIAQEFGAHACEDAIEALGDDD